MSHTNRGKIEAVLALVLVGLLTLGLAAGAATPAQASRINATKPSRMDYHDEWRKLWEDHITWTRIVIMGILDELPGTNEYVTRLIQNYRDMEDALKPYYGEDAEALGDLIQDHLVIAAELLNAAHDNDTARFNNAKERWYNNANQIAVEMSRMNPQFWPLEEDRKMWIDHLDATLEEATTHLTGNFSGEVVAYDQVHKLALEMADFFSSGVIKQFPQEFQGPPR